MHLGFSKVFLKFLYHHQQHHNDNDVFVFSKSILFLNLIIKPSVFSLSNFSSNIIILSLVSLKVFII